MLIIAILNINISEGYCKKDDYLKAKAHLMQIKPKKMHGLIKVYYYINFIYVSFYLKEYKEAMECMALQADNLSKLETLPVLGAMISIIQIFELLVHERTQEAHDLLLLSKEKWRIIAPRRIFTILKHCVNKFSIPPL